MTLPAFISHVSYRQASVIRSVVDSELIHDGFSSVILCQEVESVPFEPVLPPTATLVGMGLVTLTCIVAAVVWNAQVVPVSRTNLAISKSRGEVREYLDELDERDDAQFEKWLLSDWLRKDKEEKASALPILKDAKWNSGDNPVVVTAAIMLLGILVASFSERIL